MYKFTMSLGTAALALSIPLAAQADRPTRLPDSLAESLQQAADEVQAVSSSRDPASCGDPSRNAPGSRLVDEDFNDLSQLAGPCRYCSRTREVVLVLIVPPVTDDPREAIALASITGYRSSLRFDGLPTRYLDLRSPHSLRSALLSTAERCERVKKIYTFSHGSPGRLAAASGVLDMGNMDSVLGGGLHCAMAPGAEIQFDGCNIGRGCRGEDFLAGVASHLLRKGGSVRAATQYTLTFLITPPIPLNMDYQAITVPAGLHSYDWDNPPQSAATCANRVHDQAEELRRLAMRAQRSGADILAVNATQDARAAAEEVELEQDEMRLWPHGRTGFSSEHRRRARALADVMRQMENHEHWIERRIDEAEPSFWP